MIAEPLVVPGVKYMANWVLVADMESIVGAPGFCAAKTEVRVGAEKVSADKALVAKSLIDPEFKSREVLTAMPSVSMSLREVCTAYVKRSARELLPDA